jgi:hypothetical protein
MPAIPVSRLVLFIHIQYKHYPSKKQGEKQKIYEYLPTSSAKCVFAKPMTAQHRSMGYFCDAHKRNILRDNILKSNFDYDIIIKRM